MKKAQGWPTVLAKQSGVSTAEAADQLDHVVSEIISHLKRGQTAQLLTGWVNLSPARNGISNSNAKDLRVVQNGNRSSAKQVARNVRECLEEGKTVVIDGLGSFRPMRRGGYRFLPRTTPTVFLAYVQEDAKVAVRLGDALEEHGFDPWIDRRKLLPGQNWPRLSRMLSKQPTLPSRFSHNSVTKKGGFRPKSATLWIARIASPG